MTKTEKSCAFYRCNTSSTFSNTKSSTKWRTTFNQSKHKDNPL